MKKIIALFVFGSLLLTGCPKHEIIPAPTPKVDLSSTFTGSINGTDVELTQNVDGYSLNPTKSKIILPSPSPSSAVYAAEMKSAESLLSIKVNLGTIYFDGSVSADPTLTLFNNFFPANNLPVFTAGGLDGFEVVYRDGSGNVWTSDPALGGTVEFTNIVQESDSKGDYSKFRCTFDCTVSRTYNDSMGNPVTLTLPIQNAILTAWFKR